jgi:hypothetical protein
LYRIANAQVCGGVQKKMIAHIASTPSVGCDLTDVEQL